MLKRRLIYGLGALLLILIVAPFACTPTYVWLASWGLDDLQEEVEASIHTGMTIDEARDVFATRNGQIYVVDQKTCDANGAGSRPGYRSEGGSCGFVVLAAEPLLGTTGGRLQTILFFDPEERLVRWEFHDATAYL